MKKFIILLKSDYLQRTRSYPFLITLCISLAIAYTFIPPPDATYSTIRIGDYQGYYNSEWIGYVTAIMTSIFLSLVGFYLVNSGIKKDISSKIGQIIATTKISNFQYLLSKAIGNFLILSTIAFIIFIMSILLFFIYSTGYPFKILQFIIPYAVIVLPSLLFISVLAVFFEVFLGRIPVLQNILFFFLFSLILVNDNFGTKEFGWDIFGTRIILDQMEESVREISNIENTSGLSIGYALGNISKTKYFTFEGIHFPGSFLLSRLAWMGLGLFLLGFASIFFHRFKIKERFQPKKIENVLKTVIKSDINISKLPKIEKSFRVLPLIKTEFVLLVRSGHKWLWVLNIIGVLSLCFAPLSVAHQIILPILWFLQVSRWSSLVTKEKNFNTHFFTFASYRPLRRLLLSQVISGILLALLLATPLLVRYLTLLDFAHITTIILGGVFIVSLAVVLGILSNGKKLFEIIFFMLTYTNINAIPFTDYYGGLHHHHTYLMAITIVSAFLLIVSYTIRSIELKKI
ncbi:ABC transporter permease [Aquimarina algiphila]|uniref:hypothetical protein n=1 Tax=Aquimarina algiphila TaxID=2047982 RepID=UPI00232CAA5B|nr:hypothetical protein [Aquimarina algiphila]